MIRRIAVFFFFACALSVTAAVAQSGTMSLLGARSEAPVPDGGGDGSARVRSTDACARAWADHLAAEDSVRSVPFPWNRDRVIADRDAKSKAFLALLADGQTPFRDAAAALAAYVNAYDESRQRPSHPRTAGRVADRVGPRAPRCSASRPIQPSRSPSRP